MKRRRQAIIALAIVVVGLGAALLIPGVRRFIISSNNDKAFALMNHDRTSHGLPALHHQSQLQAYAQNWANHMASTHRLEHDAIEKHICCWDALGENVGSGSTLEDIEKAFMNSPEHRRNILYPSFTQAGVGVAWDSRDHVYYVTQAFRDPSGSSRPAPKRSATPRHTFTPRQTRRATLKPTVKPSVSSTPTASVSPSPSVFIPSPVQARQAPQVHPHHRSVLFWILFSLLVAVFVALVIFIAFVPWRRNDV